MENPHIIYEKKFPHNMDEYDAIFAEEDAGTGDEVPVRHDPAVFYKRLVENTVRIVIPDRVENKCFFISQAKKVAERNEIDTTITEYEDRLVAEFHIGDDSPNFGIKGIIEYADDVCFGCAEGEVVLSVIYYTHATYRSGKKVTPEDGQNYIM